MHKTKRGHRKKKKIKLNKTFFITLVLSLVFLSLVMFLFFYLENKIYQENYVGMPGDCGQFVIWEAAFFHNTSKFEYSEVDYLREISLETNPFKLITGPLIIKRALKKIDIGTTFYTNFSVEQIKQKLDENKSVIVMVNVNKSRKFTGATHFLFVYDYEEINNSLQGFYFTDTRYFTWNWSEPAYFDISEFEARTQNIMNRYQTLGILENLIGLEKFVIVVGEEKEENLNWMVRLVFYVQDSFIRFLAYIGKIIMAISGKV